jgi:hypothetical protein
MTTQVELLQESLANVKSARERDAKRIEELETALKATYGVMQKVRDEVPEMAYFAIITLVPEWVDAWDQTQKALKAQS